MGPALVCALVPQTCTATAFASPMGGVATFTNSSPATQLVQLIVDSRSPLDPSDFTLGVAVAQPPLGDTCWNPAQLAPNATVSATLVGLGPDKTLCASFGIDAVWSITVPAGQRMTVTVRPSMQMDTNLALTGGPGGAQCAGACVVIPYAGGPGGPGATDTLVFTNPSAAPRPVSILVGTNGPPGTYSINATFSVPPHGEVCSDPVLLTGSASLPNETLDGFDNDHHYFGMAGCAPTPGPDRVYAVDVPAGQRLLANAVSIAPDAGGAPPVVAPTNLLVFSDVMACEGAPPVCIGSAAGGRAGYHNATMATQRVLLMADQPTVLGTSFSLDVDVGPRAAGDGCGNAAPLTPGAAVNATLAPMLDDARSSDGGCLPSTVGPDAVWSFTIPANERVTVTAQPSPGLDTRLNLTAAASCAGGACLAQADSFGAGVADTLVYTNPSSTPLPVTVWVEAYGGASYQYQLLASLGPPPAGETCGSPVSLALGATLASETTAGFVDDYSYGPACQLSTGADKVYAVTVPSGSRAVLTVDSDAGAGGLSLVDTASCVSPIACATSVGWPFGAAAGPLVLSYDNAQSMPRTVYAIVDGPRSLAYSISAVGAVTPAGELCASAPVPITATTYLSSTLTDLVNNYDSPPGSTACSLRPGPDRVFAFSLGAGQRLTATVIASGAWDPALSVIEAPASNCDATPRVCLSSSDATGVAETVRHANYGSASQDVFLIIDSLSAGAAGFDLSAIIDAAPPVPVGETCANAPAPISTDTVLSMQTMVGYTNNYSSRCLADQGPDRAYAVSIGAGQQLTVSVTPGPTWDPSLALVLGSAAACAGACSTQSDVPGSAVETIKYANRTDAGVSGFVIVDSHQATGQGAFSAAFAFAAAPPLPAGDDCATAPLIAPGTLTLQTTSGLNNDYSPSPQLTQCTGYGADGLDRVYAVDVPAGKKLAVTLTPTGAASTADDASLYLLPDLAACLPVVMSCLTGADTGLGGDPESMSWVNASTSTVRVYVVADAFTGELHEFSLTVTLTP